MERHVNHKGAWDMPDSALFSGLSVRVCVCCAQAKAWDSLALFFEACAQIEIDDFRDYQKALQVLLLNPLHSLCTHCWP